MTLLRWTLGLVLAGEASRLLLSARAMQAVAHIGLPNAVRLILAWSEIIVALLFLIPPTLRLGAWGLLVVLLGAVFLHLAHGSFEVGGLLIYGVAVVAVMAHERSQQMKTEAAALKGLSNAR